MVEMLSVPNEEFQKLTYKMLHQMVLKRTKDDSVALDLKLIENDRVVEISPNLIAKINDSKHEPQRHRLGFGYCLIWMLILDHFAEAVLFLIRLLS